MTVPNPVDRMGLASSQDSRSMGCPTVDLRCNCYFLDGRPALADHKLSAISSKTGRLPSSAIPCLELTRCSCPGLIDIDQCYHTAGAWLSSVLDAPTAVQSLEDSGRLRMGFISSGDQPRLWLLLSIVQTVACPDQAADRRPEPCRSHSVVACSK